jgi:integrase
MWRYQRRHYGRDLLISELSDALAADHLAWCFDQGIKPTTVNNTHRAVWYAVWRFAAERGLVDRTPTVRKLKEGRNVPDAWTIDELNLILAHTGAAYRGAISGIPGDKYWDALIRVAWWTGLRRGSLLQLRRTDVSLQTGWLTVAPEHMKNRQGQKFRIGEDAIDSLTAIWEPHRQLLFPWPFEIRLISKHFNRILTAAGIPPSSRGLGLFHKIRRSSATALCKCAGIEAAASMLGHSTSDVTKRYIDPSKLPGHDMTKILPRLGA